MSSVVQCCLRISRLRRLAKGPFESAMYTQLSARPSDALAMEQLHSRDSNSIGYSVFSSNVFLVPGAWSDHQLSALTA